MVVSDSPSTVAISGTLSPPKKRYSTIELDQIDAHRCARHQLLGELDLHRPAAALLGSAPPRVGREDLAHGGRGDGEEVLASFEGVGARETQEGLVDERRRLQRVALRLAAEVRAQLLVDLRGHRGAGLGPGRVALAHGPQYAAVVAISASAAAVSSHAGSLLAV
jgi:hypothetical protein